MYIPKANEEKRIPVIHELMQAHPLASLVTMTTSGLFASHIPMVLEADGSEFGVLRGHISRANTQWRDLTPDVDALAIFAGAAALHLGLLVSRQARARQRSPDMELRSRPTPMAH